MAESKISVVVADDEEGMRLILRKMVERVDGFELIKEATDGKMLMETVRTLHPQVVFLDVDMPEMSGVECAKQIQDENPATILIFATGHEEYMSEAFEVYAFDYLVKPFKMERVLSTLERIRDRLHHLTKEDPMPAPHAVKAPKEPQGRLMLHHKDGVSFLNVNDILLIQREERSTVIYTTDGGRYVTGEKLGETEQKLDPDVFFRCHKSYIINLNKIKNITPYGRWTYVVQLDGTEHDALITHEKYEELERMYS